MSVRVAGIAAVGLLLMTGAAGAQAPAGDPPAGGSTPRATPTVDVDRLPIDLDRIQRKLRESRVRQGQGLHFTVDVFGQAPPLRLFTPQDNLRWGPAPYGAPVHQEMMNIITPQQFRSPMMDFSSLLRWLNQQRRQDESR